MQEIVERNKNYFAKHVSEYKEDYWRYDEEVLSNKYFTKPSAELLVLGCGAGRTLSHLSEKNLRVTGIDITPEMIDEAKKLNKNSPGVRVLLMDATALDFPRGKFDYAFFPFHGICYVYPDIYKAVKEVARVLRPGGIFIFNSHNRFYLKKLWKIFDGPYSYYNGLTTYRSTFGDKRRLLSYFKDVSICYRISLIPWGESNYKDKLYKAFPWVSKSTYYICKNPINHD